MDKYLEDLIEISRFYGNDKEFAIAGGGNTSVKDKDTLWVKASGTQLATLDEDGLAVLSRDRLKVISTSSYSSDPDQREQEVKNDLIRAMLDPGGKRPSVETSLHDLISYRFVVHLHSTVSNALLCAQNSESLVHEFFDDKVLYIPYTDPGYILFKRIENEISDYRQKFTYDPQIIFLANHGVFVSADTTGEVKRIYSDILELIGKRLPAKVDTSELPPDDRIYQVLPAIRMMLSENQPVIIRYRHNQLVEHFYQSESQFEKISLPFSPDMMVYCRAAYLFIEHEGSAENLTRKIQKEIEEFRKRNSYLPRVILIKNFGLIAAEEDYRSAETVLDIYQDLMKVSYYSGSFGGPRFLTPQQIAFIESWEVENYRKKLAVSSSGKSPVKNKIAIVTGGAQGFGAGISEELFKEGANIILADINEEEGKLKAESLNNRCEKNKAIFTRTDVSDEDSVEEMVRAAVREFGGLDILISNAGVLYAGGLHELEPELFDRLTRVNYTGFYLCTKHASSVMKLQAKYNPDYQTDIIQINSKSGLSGSKKNFAYAGAKFGGIGLTQSFALELVEYNIKVNAVCPGNYFDGPLWSDPESGLFVQYLKTGKVPGASTVEDVRKHYERQVPMNRGCQVSDILKAILYLIEQKYETGQAVAVTGGQIMLH